MILDHNEYLITGDTIVFRRPNQENQSFMPYESILLGFTFDITDTSLSEMIDTRLEKYITKPTDHPLLNNIPSILQNLKQTNYRQLFEDIYKESLLNRSFSNYYFSAKITEILYSLYNESNTYIKSHQEMITNEYLITLLKYIESHLGHSFTIEAMSKELAISERYIYKLFKEHLDTTPIKYINESRLNYSKKLLTSSNIPIHEIATMSGYDSSTYYITLFKKRFGKTPLQYRNTTNY